MSHWLDIGDLRSKGAVVVWTGSGLGFFPSVFFFKQKTAYEIAFPILRKHCAPATVFVVTEFVEGTDWLWTDKARYLATGAAAQAFEIGIGSRDLRLELNGEIGRASCRERV